MARYLRRDSLAALWLLPRSRSPREETAHLERSRVRLLAQLQQSLPIVNQPSKTRERSANGVWRYQVPGGPLLLVVTDHTVKVVGAAASWPGGLSLEDGRTARQSVVRLLHGCGERRRAVVAGRGPRRCHS